MSSQQIIFPNKLFSYKTDTAYSIQLSAGACVSLLSIILKLWSTFTDATVFFSLFIHFQDNFEF